ncbi:insulinase family protein [Candidatus Kaiserbacteria bacterium]|nr:insulinase family protein [Candidatus Kaiserbacteria bacterium]
MKFNIDRKETFSFATITQKNDPKVSAFITIDIHQENSLSTQAAQLMFSDVLLSGAGKYTRDEFLSAVNTLGASVDVSLGNGNLTITLRASSQNFKKLLPLVETMLTTPTFSKTEITRIKSTLTNELHEAKENSRAIAYEELLNTIYGSGDRKFTYEIEELISALQRVNIQKLKSLHQVVLSQPWTCSVAGDDDYLEAFKKMISKVKKNYSIPKTIIGIHQQKTPQKICTLKNIPSKQNIDFNIGAPVPITLHHPDYIPLAIAVDVLAMWGNFAGRLMETARIEEGLTYTIFGKVGGFTGSEQGFWRIWTFFSPDKALQGIKSTFNQIEKLYKEGISEAELTKFKTILNTQQILIQDSITGQLRDLHAYHCHQFTLQEMKEHKEKINSVTLEEVNDAIRTYLNPNTLTISGAGPVNAVKKDLQAFIKSV